MREDEIKSWLEYEAAKDPHGVKGPHAHALALIGRLGKMADELLDHCPISECDVCSEIVCPHGDTLHLHRDGCPSCCSAAGLLA